jgi:hypothetical protein
MSPDPVLTGSFGQSTPQIGLPPTGESLEHDVLAPVDEAAGHYLRDHSPSLDTGFGSERKLLHLRQRAVSCLSLWFVAGS